MDRPITPFYCCYLLRSTTAKLKRGPSLYVGSTPNPRRRLKQHNGETRGGAQKTKRDNRRPWEMTIVVAGFPSKIAALQFEWAWQHPQVTRHISSAEWNSEVVTNNEQPSTKAGKRKKPPSRPRTGLVAKLLDLQLLLRARSFARWPLNVTFFSRDVYAIWNGKDVQPYRRLPDDFQATLESSIPTTGREPSPITQDMEMAERMVRFDRRTTTAALYSLSVDYSGIKAQLERSLFLLDGTRFVSCAICTGDLVHQAALTVLCSNSDCNAPFHLHCLATRFLDQDCGVGELLPQNGQCPCCGSSMHWSDLVKELSLRSHGQDEVRKLLKPSKRKKAHAISEGVAERSELMQNPNGNDRFADEEDDDDEDAKDDEDEYDAGFAEAHPTQSRSHGASASTNDLDSDGDLPLPSIERRPKERSRQVNKDRLHVPVVADSEWDDVEEIT